MAVFTPIMIHPQVRNCIIIQNVKYCEEVNISSREVGWGLILLILIIVWAGSSTYFLADNLTIGLVVVFAPLILGVIYCFI